MDPPVGNTEYFIESRLTGLKSSQFFLIISLVRMGSFSRSSIVFDVRRFEFQLVEQFMVVRNSLISKIDHVSKLLFLEPLFDHSKVSIGIGAGSDIENEIFYLQFDVQE